MICYGSCIDELRKIDSFEKEAGIQYLHAGARAVGNIGRGVREARKIGIPGIRGAFRGLKQGWQGGMREAGKAQEVGAKAVGGLAPKDLNIAPWYKRSLTKQRDIYRGLGMNKAHGPQAPVTGQPTGKGPVNLPEPPALPSTKPAPGRIEQMQTAKRQSAQNQLIASGTETPKKKEGPGFGLKALGGLATAGLIGVPLAAGYALGQGNQQQQRPPSYGMGGYYG